MLGPYLILLQLLLVDLRFQLVNTLLPSFADSQVDHRHGCSMMFIPKTSTGHFLTALGLPSSPGAERASLVSARRTEPAKTRSQRTDRGWLLAGDVYAMQ